MLQRTLNYPELADPMVRPRYTGLATFMRLPYAQDLAGLDIGLIGVPFDGGVTNRPGARHGPREIRNQSSLMRRINQASGIEPYALCRIADIGDAWIEKPFELAGAHGDRGRIRRDPRGRVVPISAGGDHSVSLPILRAIAREQPVGMVHFDAIATPATTISAQNFIMARRSAGQSRKACSIRSGPFRSAFAARSTIVTCGNSAATAAQVVPMEELYEKGRMP